MSAAPRVPSGFRAAPSGNIPRAQQLLGWRGAIASETATRLGMLPSMGRIDPALKQNGMGCRIYESVMGLRLYPGEGGVFTFSSADLRARSCK